MSSLLEEAIVDAKALKEAALKNAEDAVLEKYSGEVRKALDTLLEQDEMGLEEDEANGEDLMEFTEEVPFAFANEEINAPGPEEIVEIDFDALKARLEEEEEVVESTDMIDATAMADDIALEEGDINPDIAQMEDDEDAAEKSTAAASATPTNPLEEDEEIDLTEEMLADLIEELVVDMTPVPQGWSSMNSADNFVQQANNDAMAAAEGAHLEEDEEIEEDASTASDVVDAKLFETKISKLTDSNTELRALIMEAKGQLTKLNLDNAKLVYQNKALNSASLNERQKTQIAEAIQTATSVEEAGMIYETIQNAVGSTPVQRTRPQTLREAVQRPTSLLLNSKKNNTATIDPNMGRMLRLAGLNK
jgi:hypothetical protein